MTLTVRGRRAGAAVRSLPLLDPAVATLARDAGPADDATPPLDRSGRPLHDLRISVTDRCNFRCLYCMPSEAYGPGHHFLPRDSLLTFEEIERLVRSLVPLGVRKVRLTGGEPLLRGRLEILVGMLAAIPHVDDLTLTTNGSLLAGRARALRDAGLRRVTISLDSLDEATHRRISGSDVPVSRILGAIEAASRAGLGPVKVNTVVRRGLNDGQVVDLARRFRGTGHVVRFIEYMDVGHTNGWRLDDVVPAAEIVERIDQVFPLEAIGAAYRGEVARRYRYRDGAGEIGMIASVSEPFCGDCTRARLSADGLLFTCLFAGTGHDLRGALRGGANDAQLERLVRAIWTGRTDRYSELRSAATAELPRVEMSYLGG